MDMWREICMKLGFETFFEEIILPVPKTSGLL